MDLKLTTRSQEAMSAAVRTASTDGHAQVEPAHLLAAVLHQSDGAAIAVLTELGVDVAAVRSAADRTLAAAAPGQRFQSEHTRAQPRRLPGAVRRRATCSGS